MNVSLTPELEKLVRRKVASGHYGSASEVVRASLRLLQAHERELDTWVQESRRKIATGLRSLDQGRWVPSEEFEKRTKTFLAAKKRRRSKG